MNTTSVLKNTTIIAIGTEVTSGQIINRNASWLSSQLIEMGFNVLSHMSVPDSPSLMKAAFEWAERQGQLIVLTGGLGPTSDDLTKEVLAEHLGLKQELKQEAWDHIESYLKNRGRRVLPSHRKVAEFFEGSVLFKNTRGTAFGCFVESPSCSYVVLPGPPQEIECIWQNGLETYLKARAPKKEVFLNTWQTLGPGESEIAEITEKVLKNEGLEIGYRLAPPFVEVKVWAHKDDTLKWKTRLEQELAPWIVTRQGEDLAHTLLANILKARKTNVEFVDLISGNFLASRVLEHRAWLEANFFEIQFRMSLLSQKTRFSKETSSPSTKDLSFCLGPWVTDSTFEISTQVASAPKTIQVIELPVQSPVRERNERSSAELAFLHWSRLSF